MRGLNVTLFALFSEQLKKCGNIAKILGLILCPNEFGKAYALD